MKVFENEREALRQTHGEVLNDMSLCKAKEAELLAYTQQVTENSVALQANLSSLEAKVSNECDQVIFRSIVFLNLAFFYFAELCDEERM